MKKFILLWCCVLVLLLSIGIAVLPIILGILFSWYWLFLYSFHLITIIFMGLVCHFAPEGKEEEMLKED